MQALPKVGFNWRNYPIEFVGKGEGVPRVNYEGLDDEYLLLGSESYRHPLGSPFPRSQLLLYTNLT